MGPSLMWLWVVKSVKLFVSMARWRHREMNHYPFILLLVYFGYKTPRHPFIIWKRFFQLLDGFFFRIWKSFIRKITDRTLLQDHDVQLFQWETIVKLRSLIHRQFAWPLSKKFFMCSGLEPVWRMRNLPISLHPNNIATGLILSLVKSAESLLAWPGDVIRKRNVMPSIISLDNLRVIIHPATRCFLF